MSDKRKILDKAQLDQKVNRLAWEIYEKNYNEKELIIAGIESRGIDLALRISDAINNISDINVITSKISIDKKNPLSSEVKISLNPSDYKGKVIILVDDVLNSGRTLMYASKELLSVSLSKLSIAVLVHRNHSSYPIHADFVGLSLSTTLQDHINVVFGKQEGVYLS